MKNALLIILIFFSLNLWASSRDSCEFFLNKAREEFYAGNNASALELLIKAQHCPLSLNDRLDFYELSSRIYESFNKYYNAIRYLLLKQNILEKVIDTSDSPLYENQLYKTYIKLAQLHQKLSEYNISGDYYIKAVTLCHVIKDKAKLAAAYSYLAYNYMLTNQYSKALSNYYYSNKNYRYVGDTQNEIKTLFKIAKIYAYQGQYKNAFETYFKILELSHENNNFFVSKAYINIAKLLSELNLLDEEEKYLDKAIRANSGAETQIKYNILLARLLLKKNLLDSARSLLTRTLVIIPQDKPLERSDIYELLAQTYLAQDKYSQAYKYILIAYNLRIPNKDKLRLALSYLDLGKYYLAISDYNRAQIYLKKSYIIFRQINNFYYLQKNAFYLSSLYKDINDYQKAFTYIDIYGKIEDSIVKRNQAFVLNSIEEKSRTELESKLIRQKLKLSRKYNLRLAVFSLLLFIMLFFTLYLRRRIKKKNILLKRQKQELEQAHREIQRRFRYYRRLYIATYLSKNSIFVTKPDGIIVWFNKTCQEIYGLTNDTIGKNLKNLSTYKRINDVFRFVNEKKTVRYINFHIFNNKKIWLQTTISPLIKQGRVYEIIAIEHDVTDYIINSTKIKLQQKELKKKNELLEDLNEELKNQQEILEQKNKELLEQQKRLIEQQEELKTNAEILNSTVKKLRQFSIAIDSTDNLIFFINTNCEITWVNKAFEQKTKFDIKYLVEPESSRQWLNNLFKLSPEFKHFYQKAINEKRSFSFISQLIFDKQKFWLQTTLSPIHGPEEKVENIVVIQTDITKLKEAEEKLTQKNQEIISSIQYAKRIQQALLPMEIFMRAVFYKNYFIFFRPRDIVSGDFYWARAHKGKVLLAIADGTGHGIPGSFMSVIGTLALNTVSDKLKDINASRFLSELTQTVSLILRQRGKKNEARDSIDLAFCIFDFDHKTLEYSGAYVPLYLLRNNGGNIETIILPANKRTIGYDMHIDTEFFSHKIKLQDGDMIYISTDGFLDQFGGQNNKKYKRGRFISLLKNLYHFPVQDQLSLIKQEYNKWKGDNQQVDDILVFGLRINKDLI